MEFFLDENDFLIGKFLDNNLDFDKEEAERQLKYLNNITHGKKFKVLIDATESFHIPTNEAKEILAANDLKIAEAILIKQTHQRIVANFYMKLTKKKQKHPIKVFSNKEKAIEWLKNIDNQLK